MRPEIFEEIAGHDIAKKILKSIIKNPEKSPKVFIFEGQMGTGKTTTARILARALNCESPKSSGSPCLECENCKQDLDTSNYYYEYNAAVVGNVEDMKRLKETFAYSTGAKWKVIVFDEVQGASAASQGILLKELEDVIHNNFYVFCTTEVRKVINTIQSRALSLNYDKIGSKDMLEGLNRLIKRENLTVPPEIIQSIIKRSNGHMRDAHKYLYLYSLVNDEVIFQEFIRVADKEFKNLFISLFKPKEVYFTALGNLLTFPLVDLKNDFQNLLLEITKAFVGIEEGDEQVKEILKLYGNGWLNFSKLLLSPWILDSFHSDITFQTAFLGLYQMTRLSNTSKKEGTVTQSSLQKK